MNSFKFVSCFVHDFVLTVVRSKGFLMNIIKMQKLTSKVSNVNFILVCFSPAMTDPVPGAYKVPCVPMPFLNLDPNVLTTEVSYQAASMFDLNAVEVVGALRYEIYLTYMYERDLSEEKYWDTLIGTRTLQGLQENGKLVSTATYFLLISVFVRAEKGQRKTPMAASSSGKFFFFTKLFGNSQNGGIF